MKNASRRRYFPDWQFAPTRLHGFCICMDTLLNNQWSTRHSSKVSDISSCMIRSSPVEATWLEETWPADGQRVMRRDGSVGSRPNLGGSKLKKRRQNIRKSYFMNTHFCFWLTLWRSVRSCSQTIPEKVRNSISMNMGFKGWGWLPWWSWVIFKPFRYKKFNRRAQTVNFSVLSRLRQELCAEKPQNMEKKGN